MQFSLSRLAQEVLLCFKTLHFGLSKSLNSLPNAWELWSYVIAKGAVVVLYQRRRIACSVERIELLPGEVTGSKAFNFLSSSPLPIFQLVTNYLVFFHF